MYNKIDVTSPVRKFQNPIRNCFNSSASAEAANAFSAWKRKKDDVERLNALTMRDADDEENVFWIDDENDDFFVFSALLSISNPDFQSDSLGEETTQTLPSKFLRLHFELLLFEVLLVEEEAAMRKLEEEFKANMMIENFTHEMFFLLFFCQKKKYPTPQKISKKERFEIHFILLALNFFNTQVDIITQLKIDMCNSKCILFLTTLRIRNANSSENVGYIYFLSL